MTGPLTSPLYSYLYGEGGGALRVGLHAGVSFSSAGLAGVVLM